MHKVQGYTFGTRYTGYRAQGTGHRAQGTGYRTQDTGFRVQSRVNNTACNFLATIY
jgi:hypothetical protein